MLRNLELEKHLVHIGRIERANFGEGHQLLNLINNLRLKCNKTKNNK